MLLDVEVNPNQKSNHPRDVSEQKVHNCISLEFNILGKKDRGLLNSIMM